MLIDDFISRHPHSAGDLPDVFGERDSDGVHPQMGFFLRAKLPQAARYDVNNIIAYALRGGFDQLCDLSLKSPVYPPYLDIWLEYSHKGERMGVLMCWDEPIGMWRSIGVMEDRRYGWYARVSPNIPVDESFMPRTLREDCSSLTDKNGEMWGTTVVGIWTLALLNWDREVFPTREIDMSRTNRKRRSLGRHQLSNPTVIDIGALRNIYVKSETSSTSDTTLHPVRGHLRVVSPARPLFGGAAIPGKTCGVLRVRPHLRGNPEFGAKTIPSYTFPGDIRVQ